MDRTTDGRVRASDDTRPTPTGPVQPAPDRKAAVERGDRGSLVRRLREQVASGTYAPPLDDVAERLSGFFVIDRPYLQPRSDDA